MVQLKVRCRINRDFPFAVSNLGEGAVFLDYQTESNGVFANQ